MANCIADFDNEDFDHLDFQVEAGGYNFDFKNYLFNALPDYFHEQDTYKNSQGQGLLQRFTQVIGLELDRKIVPKINCYLEIIDSTICEERFLHHISDTLGNPPDVFQDPAIYRNLLSYIVSVYKIKGTTKAYELFFSILGFGVDIIEYPPADGETNYDQGGNYNTGNELSIYDHDICLDCKLYSIEFYPLEGNSMVVTPAVISKLQAAIEFNEPINAKLIAFTSILRVEDNLSLGVSDSETHTIDTSTINLYDEGKQYDSEMDYDTGDDFGNDITTITFDLLVETLNDNNYRINTLFPSSIAPTGIDYSNTFLTLRGYNTQGDIIYQESGDIINPTLDIDGNIKGTLIKYLHEVESPAYFKLFGSISLGDGKASNVDITVPLVDSSHILYFL